MKLGWASRQAENHSGFVKNVYKKLPESMEQNET